MDNEFKTTLDIKVRDENGQYQEQKISSVEDFRKLFSTGKPSIKI